MTVECTGGNWKLLEELEHQLKHIHQVRTFLVEPREKDIPVLLSINVDINPEHEEQLSQAAQRITHELFSFLHSSKASGHEAMVLVNAAGIETTIETLTEEGIQQTILEALAA
jgi:hypothetical protein